MAEPLKNRYKNEGTILKDYEGDWWVIKKYHLHFACASYVEMVAYHLKADGSTVSLNFDPESVDRMVEVTPAELVLYGKEHSKSIR